MSAATDPRAGAGSSAAGTSPPPTGPAVSDGCRAVFSKGEFADLAERILASGGRWKDVGAAAGCSADAAKQRGYRLGLRSMGKRACTRRWTPDVVIKVGALAVSVGTVQCAQRLGTTPAAIRQALRRMTTGIRAIKRRVEA